VELNIRRIDYSGSVVDGPGVRAVLFVQGCDQRCPGCHNPETWDPAGGVRRPVEELVRELRERVPNRKLTISGGEPLLQADAVVALLDGVRGFDVALYTGFERDVVPREILARIHHVKVGRFDASRRTTTVPFVGSTNQSFVTLAQATP